MLVVVSIIAVLAALLLPVMGQSREQAQTILCASNIRQVGIAQTLYADDYDGYITHMYAYEKASVSGNVFPWAAMLNDYSPVPCGTWSGTNYDGGSFRVVGLPTSNRKNIFTCAQNRPGWYIYGGTWEKFGAENVYRTGGTYALNGLLLQQYKIPGAKPNPGDYTNWYPYTWSNTTAYGSGPRRMMDVLRPDSTSLINEGLTYWNSWIRSETLSYSNNSYSDQSGSFSKYYRYRAFPYHRERANHTFIDGHTEAIETASAMPNWSVTLEYRRYFQWWRK